MGRLFIQHFFAGSKHAQVLVWTQSLSQMLQAGLHLFDALQTLEQSHTQPAYRPVIKAVLLRLRLGQSLCECLRPYDDFFDPLYCAVIRMGEGTGQIKTSLSYLSAYLKKRHEQRQKILSACLYPLMVLGFGLVACVVLLAFFVPALKEMARSLEMPDLVPHWLDIAAISHYLHAQSWALGGLATAAALLVWLTVRSPWGQHRLGLVARRLPGVGSVIDALHLSAFSYTLGMLFKGGIETWLSLELAWPCLRNKSYAHGLSLTRYAMTQGRDVPAALEQTKLFPAFFIQLLTLGRQNPSWHEAYFNCAEYYQNKAYTGLERLVGLITPVATLLLTVGIGSVAYVFFNLLDRVTQGASQWSF
jgi:type II secretory pathway component PulF